LIKHAPGTLNYCSIIPLRHRILLWRVRSRELMTNALLLDEILKLSEEKFFRIVRAKFDHRSTCFFLGEFIEALEHRQNTFSIWQEKDKTKTTMIVFESHEIRVTSKGRNLKWTNQISMEEKTWKSNTLPLWIDRKRTAMYLAMNTTRTDKRGCLTERGKAKNSFLATHVPDCPETSMTKASVPPMKTESRAR
jgi:hypothetical protein